MLRTIALLLFVVSSACAQDFSYVHYSVAEGLPSAEVYQVFQDKQGFIWFATDNGVARFDGNDMETFHARQGLPDPVVFGFYEDPKERLWFRSFSGRLSYFENGKITKYAWNDSIAALCKKSILHSITVDSLDRVWLGAGEFVGCISPDGHITTEKTPAHQLHYRTIGNGFIVGHYWPSSLVTSIKINDKAFAVPPPEKNFDNPTVNAIRWKGSLYISMANIIYRYNGDSFSEVYRVKDHVISLSLDRKDRLWVGLRLGGVEYFSDPDLKDPLALDFLKGKSVTKVLEDNQHGFWFTTLQNGVYHIPNFYIRQFTFPQGSKITSAISFGSSTLLGDADGTLTLLDNKTLTIRRQTKLPGASLFSIFVDSRRNIWATTIQSSFRLDSMLVIKGKIPVENDFFEKDGIIYGMGRARILRFNLEGKELGQISLSTIHRSIVHAPPFVLMASRTGLNVYDYNFKLVETPEVFKEYKISRMQNLNDSTLLICTSGSGYFVVEKKTWRILSRSEGKNFIGDNIYSSLIVGQNVWIGTEKGITATSVKSLITNSGNFVFLDQQSGISSNKINLLCHAEPNIWAFTDQGFSILPKNPEVFNAAPPRFYLKDILVNDKVVSVLDQQELTFLMNNLQINFGYISFQNSHILLRSRLTQNGPWHYSEEKNLKFYSLAPGSYHFQLQYTTDMTHWVDAMNGMSFVILQPWWKTSWFQAVLIASIALVLYLVFSSQMTVLQHKNDKLNVQNENKKNLIQAEIEALERERSRIAKDLHDGIGMNLTVLKLHLHDLLKNHGEPGSQAIEDQLKSTIEEIRSIVHNLTPVGIALFGLSDVVKDYITRTTAHLSTKIEMFSSGKKVMDPKISLFSFRIIQELIANSLKHSQCTRITIRINGFDDSLNIIYQDNGIGFDPENCKHGSGLLNIQARIESMAGTSEFNSGEHGVLYIINVPLKAKQADSATIAALQSDRNN